MTGMLAAHAEPFLRAVSLFTVVVFSIPILVAPLTWARVFRWNVDARSDLALYFGRCLGVFAVLMSWGAWYAADHPEFRPIYFNVLVAFCLGMVVVHLVGAIQKVQPWTETAEIPMWGGLALLGVLFMPVA
jgi:hypothetical protein